MTVSVCQLPVAQEFGLQRFKTQWKQINLDTVCVIFTEENQETAQRVANLTLAMARQFPIQGSEKLDKIEILLQDRTTVSNGYVGYAPFRSEFYLNPYQNPFVLGSMSWADLLAIHEFRHVQQLTGAKRGFSKLMYLLTGEFGYSGTVHLSLPDWYIEGDAVIAETALTRQGRGRLNHFIAGFRSRLEEPGLWNYQRLRNGSLKTWLPDHYTFGFLLANYGRLEYGQAFWDSTMLDAAAYRTLLYPFSGAMKKQIGKSSRAFYEEAFAYYRKYWARAEPGQIVQSDRLLDEVVGDRYHSARFPAADGRGHLYFAVERFDQNLALHRYIHPGKTERVTSLGIMAEPWFSLSDTLISWTERRYHPRWIREDHSVIMLYDRLHRKKRQLTHTGNYMMPAIAPQSGKIAAVFSPAPDTFILQILSSHNGSILKTLPNPENYFYNYPVWSVDEEKLYCAVRNARGEMAMISQDIVTGAVTSLTPFSMAPIGRPWINGAKLYFAQSTPDMDQIFSLDLDSGDQKQLTFGGSNKYQPVIWRDSLVYSTFTLKGYQLEAIALDEAESMGRSARPGLPSHFQRLPGEGTLSGQLDEKVFPVEPYSRLSQPVNVHSWTLFAEDPNYGVEIRSNNILNTIQINGGLQYNRNDDAWGPFADLTLGFLYPEITLGYTGWKRSIVRPEEGQLRFFQQGVNAGLALPLRGLHGQFFRHARLATRIERLSLSGDLDFAFTSMTHSVSLLNRLLPAVQHPTSRFGQAFRLAFRHSIDAVSARQLHIYTDWTVPSPFRNHVFWLQFDFRHELMGNDLTFGDHFAYSRGYRAAASDHMFRVGINYQFPVAYPDIGIAGIMYFKRLRLNLFYDHAEAHGEEIMTSKYRSFGGELYFDTEVFNVETFEFGIRLSRLIDPNPITNYNTTQFESQKWKIDLFLPFLRI